jgi:hypothetical protein
MISLHPLCGRRKAANHRQYVEKEKMMPVIVKINPLDMQQIYHLIYHPSKVKEDTKGTWIN